LASIENKFISNRLESVY